MGCDIHPWVEVRQNGKWTDMGLPPEMERLGDRTYGRFAFLTGGSVRNMSGVPEVLPAPRGLPGDCTRGRHDDTDWGYHSETWLGLDDLLGVDYDQKFNDVRGTTMYRNGKMETTPGPGVTTLREFLGDTWFEMLGYLVTLGKPENVRLCFGFDS